VGDIIYVDPKPCAFIKLRKLCGYFNMDEMQVGNQRVCIADSEKFHSEEVVIHAAPAPSVMSLNDIMEFMNSGELDPGSLKILTMDDTFDSDLNSKTSVILDAKEESESSDSEDGGFMKMFSGKKSSKMTIRKKIVEVNDPEVRKMINACRDGYFLKKSASYWLMDQEDKLFKKYEDEEIGFGYYFHNQFIAQVFSDCKYGTKGVSVKCPNSLRTLVNQIFESPPIMNIRFTEDGDTLYISQSGLKLVRLSQRMKESPNPEVSKYHALPLLALSLAYGR